MTDKINPASGRDVNLREWLDGVGFHPANTELKQLGHDAARLLAALYGTHLHQILPPGRLKSIAFTKLEEVLQRSNQALAVGGGPHPLVDAERLLMLTTALKGALADLESVVPYDPRIEEYEAGQLEEAPEPATPLEPFEYTREIGPGHTVTLEAGLTGTGAGEPEVKIKVTEHDEGENLRNEALLFVDDPEVTTQLSAYLMSVSVRLRALQAR